MNRRTAALPSLWALLFLAACIIAAAFITYRADAQNTTPTATQSSRPAPSKPEESATIEDDPTLVPDDKESADNNVSFPVDI